MPRSLSIPPAEFDALVENALAAVPAKYRRLLTNTVVVVERDSPRGELLGLHEHNPPFPDRIVIYQRPHEAESRNRRELAALVYETLLHEIGHAFGMDEAQVLRMERARRRRLNRLRSADAANPGTRPPRPDAPRRP
jgi:predicted Zn-dependent protease with MMP-like domain